MLQYGKFFLHSVTRCIGSWGKAAKGAALLFGQPEAGMKGL